MAAERPTLGRRQALHAAAGVLTAGAASAVLSGCRDGRASSAPAPAPRVPGFTPRLFSAEQAMLVEDMAEHILPETDTPGAKRAGVAAFVEGIVLEVYEERECHAFLMGLDLLDAEAREAHGAAFILCSSERQLALVTRQLERERAAAPATADAPPWSFFRAFRELCIEGFCQSKVGATRVMQYESVPGAFQGCVPLESVGKAWSTS